MHSWLESFVLTFVPLFVAINPLGNLPVFISLSEGSSGRERRKMINVAVLTAAIVGLAFLFFGEFILNVMGISVGSFAIAGGLILLVLAMKHMITGKMVEAAKAEMVAVVPIGTPLTAGPATITTLLLLTSQLPLYMVLLSFGLNMLIVWIVFLLCNRITGFIGRGGLNAISQAFMLLLAAIAVTMIIKGLNLVGIVSTSS